MHSKSKIRIIFLLLISLISGLKATAQDQWESPDWKKPDLNRGFSLYLIIPSFISSPYSNINPLLVENGYPSLPRGNFNYGIGLAWRFNSVELGLEPLIGHQRTVHSTFNSELVRNPLTANLYANYHFIKKRDFTIFGLVGYSGTINNLVASKANTTDNFNTLLTNPGTSVNLQHYSDGILVGVGVGIHKMDQEDSGTYRLKFAYRIPYASGMEWESRFANFNNAPSDSFPYLFVQFEIGFIGNWKKGEHPN